MFHIKLKFISNFIAFAIVSLSFPAFGAPGHDDKFMVLETRDMNLTVEQKQKLKEIQDLQRDGMKAKRDAMDAARNELEHALKDDSSEVKIREKFANLKILQTEFEKVRFEAVLAIRALLTVEQRQKLKLMERPHGRGRRQGLHESRRHRHNTSNGTKASADHLAFSDEQNRQIAIL